ncbi:acyl-CoA dehydrogenase [Actinocrinis puniceicyclus]|uniref:Broad-specificity linear acyl-CoA dehydrogenase FadE5 n=1 Tax=Actinocrinis puniceicyclus TaxID=977794 RepID=A0A8J7WL12_9ACTN|nr:acyl-CoA dehydrogenase [Actinocrinis puniceicyclus]MBS2963258.1 acyl-CoA dehydrogenase [Actinocrinis puniceicyclus]
MGHYKSNLRDIEFNLFEVFDSGTHYGSAAYPEIDVETARTILGELERLAVTELAESFADADRNPPDFDPSTHSATLPESFKRSYKAYMDTEYWRLGLPEEMGGTLCPASLRWAAGELVLGANPAIWIYAAGTDFGRVLWELGTDEQRKIAKLMAEHLWGATMVLTEPDAGSDVGAGRTKAVEQPDGSWHIEGVKRFITSGDHDLSENIIHLVLARPEGHGPGTKGLSLFVVPKFLFDWDTGELGERNGVFVTNVEHKMGLKVSTTCELTFGADRPAKGWLVGEVHNGIAQMFNIIEMARMMVGTKAIATLSTGYLNALEYAKTRVQGADLPEATNKNAPRVTITHHADVRRLLMQQKAYAEGMRALVFYTASWQDRVYAARLTGGEDELAERINDFLLPIVKGYGSEKSYEQLAHSLQILGGSGYLQDYPIEQYIRDAKIDTLYEGTTAIQGMDLFFRKIVKDQGRALTHLKSEIQAFLDAGVGGERLAVERDLLAGALGEVEAMANAMFAQAAKALENAREIYVVGQSTTDFLYSVGDLVIGWLLLRQAAVALDKSAAASARDVPFYTGKVAAASWFARNVLPLLTARRAVVEATDNALMDVPEEAF